MAGTGKRGDQKKTLVLLTPGYFGKSRALRRGNLPKKLKSINVQDLKAEVDYSGYKILSKGDAPKGLKVKAGAASAAALEKVKKAGGAVELPVKKERPVPKKEETKEEST
jgi:ribosomal protein L15